MDALAAGIPDQLHSKGSITSTEIAAWTEWLVGDTGRNGFGTESREDPIGAYDASGNPAIAFISKNVF
jgi:hypothetical protein